jgi:hypothetical protein
MSGICSRACSTDLALAVIGSVVSGQIGGNAMVWHTRLGLG